MWIGEQPGMQMDFWQFSRNADICVIPGKLSEIHFYAWLFSDAWGKVLKSIKSRVPFPWIGEQPCMQMDFWQFSRNADICGIPAISSWTFFHKCDIYNLIHVFIHVKKTFKALPYQMCGNIKKKLYIYIYLQCFRGLPLGWPNEVLIQSPNL